MWYQFFLLQWFCFLHAHQPFFHTKCLATSNYCSNSEHRKPNDSTIIKLLFPHKWQSVLYSSSSELGLGNHTCCRRGGALIFFHLECELLAPGRAAVFSKVLDSDIQETGEQVLYMSSWVAPLDERLWEPCHWAREQDSAFHHGLDDNLWRSISFEV